MLKKLWPYARPYLGIILLGIVIQAVRPNPNALKD